jgi:hypothetical protein
VDLEGQGAVTPTPPPVKPAPAQTTKPFWRERVEAALK